MFGAREDFVDRTVKVDAERAAENGKAIFTKVLALTVKEPLIEGEGRVEIANGEDEVVELKGVGHEAFSKSVAVYTWQ